MATKITAVLTSTAGAVYEAQGNQLVLSLVKSTSKSHASGVWDPPYATVYLSKTQSSFLAKSKELGDAVCVAFEQTSGDEMSEIRVNGCC